MGETLAQAVVATKSLQQRQGHRLAAQLTRRRQCRAPAKYNSIGENVVASKFIFQWQHGQKFVQVLPAGATGSVPIVNPRPDWGKG